MLTRLVTTDHVEKRMLERDVTMEELRRVLTDEEVIQRYPDDEPYPSYLMLGFAGRRPLHVVAADAEELDTTFVVTVYEPDPEEWTDDFKTKRAR